MKNEDIVEVGKMGKYMNYKNVLIRKTIKSININKRGGTS